MRIFFPRTKQIEHFRFWEKKKHVSLEYEQYQSRVLEMFTSCEWSQEHISRVILMSVLTVDAFNVVYIAFLYKKILSVNSAFQTFISRQLQIGELVL